MATVIPGAGELNLRVTLRLCTDVPNGAFGVTHTFDAGIKRWAKHEPIHSLAIRGGMNVGESPTDFFWLRRGAGTKPEQVSVSHVIEAKGRRYRVLDTLDVDGIGTFTRVTTKDIGAVE